MARSQHIALVSITFDPLLRDGASRSLLAQLQFLRQRGCRVSILCFHAAETRRRLLFENPAATPPGVNVVGSGHIGEGVFQGLDFRQELLPCTWPQVCQGQGSRIVVQRLQQATPDHVITVDEDYLPLFAARFLGIPGAHRFGDVPNVQRFATSADHVRFLRDRTVLVNSRFLQARVKALLGLDAVVWTPHIRFDEYVARREGRQQRIGFYSAGKEKGDEVVNAVVARLPERAFVVVGERYSGWPGGDLPDNLAYWGHVPDMRRFYGQIDLLLAPSIKEEPFGRVILEAAVNGIPTIANRVGGIPEALGDSGVLVDWDRDRDIAAVAGQYVREIRRLMDDEAVYRQYSQKARARAKAYQREQARSAGEICERYFG